MVVLNPTFQVSKLPTTISLVKDLADRLRDPAYAISVARDDASRVFDWNDVNLAFGPSGLILLFSTLDYLYPNETWANAAHDYILRLKEALENNFNPNLSLHNGLAGAAFAIHFASKQGKRYKRILEKIDQFILDNIRHLYFGPILKILKGEQLRNISYFDVAQGISGIGVYLLSRKNHPLFANTLNEIIDFILNLTKSIEISGFKYEGWVSIYSNDSTRGVYNLGLFEGIAGILGFLSLCSIRGYHWNPIQEAIQKISAWIWEQSLGQDGITWLPSFETTEVRKNLYSNSWGYGTPGIARALFMAGQALNSKILSDKAVEVFTANANKPREWWNLPSPTLNNGLAGYMLSIHQMAKNANHAGLMQTTDHLKEHILKYYSTKNPLGFQNYYFNKAGELFRVSSPSLLEGTAGILLALISVEEDCNDWQWPFLNIL